MVQHPFQCLQRIPKSRHLDEDVLIAAAGPRVFSFGLERRALLSTWPRAVADACEEEDDVSVERPAKRQRTEESSKGSFAETIVQKPQSLRKVKSKAPLPFVIRLAATSDKRHIVVVTAEDKCIRVFEIGPKGDLRLLSERCMPKRPNAIDITSDDKTILCADKFGDLYSLPLLVPETASATVDVEPAAIKEKDEEASKDAEAGEFVPSANTFTVHTQRNLRALQNQLKVRPKRAEKKLEFEHELLLGHVSLLTDVLSVDVTTATGKQISYILTSDRDEHIRVSRGIPQADIIEAFCFGHAEFVSKLCVPSWQRGILISGGGDDCLFVWQWREGQLLQKVELKHRVDDVRGHIQPRSEAVEQETVVEVDASKQAAEETGSPSVTSDDIAVSGIWSVPLDNDDFVGIIFVACEGIPALFSFSLNARDEVAYLQTTRVSGNVLDVVPVQEDSTVIVSVDSVHEPGSTKEIRTVCGQVLLEEFRYSVEPDAARQSSRFQGFVETINKAGSFDMEAQMQRDLSGSLYTIENLRKRGFDDDDD